MIYVLFNNDELENDYNNIYPHELEFKKKNEDLVKPHFWTFRKKSMTENFRLICLIKEMHFPFIVIACPIWTAI